MSAKSSSSRTGSSMWWSVKTGALIGLLALFCPPAMAGGLEQGRWSTPVGGDLVQVYQVPPRQSTSFALNRTHYDVAEQMFILDMAELPAHVNEAAPPKPEDLRHMAFLLRLVTQQSQWLTTEQGRDLFNADVLPLPPFGAAFALSLEDLRAGTASPVEQPYGALDLVPVLQETQEKQMRLWPPGMADQTGGTIGFDVRDDAGSVLASFRAEFIKQPLTYRGVWSPDGRWVFLPLPQRAKTEWVAAMGAFATRDILVLGPFETTRSREAIRIELRDRAAKEGRASRAADFAAGKMTADEFFGPALNDARARVQRCADLRDAVGPIYALSIKNAKDARPLYPPGDGDRLPVGQLFTMTLDAEKVRGKVVVAGLDPAAAPAIAAFAADQGWTNDVQTVMVHTTDGVLTLKCP